VRSEIKNCMGRMCQSAGCLGNDRFHRVYLNYRVLKFRCVTLRTLAHLRGLLLLRPALPYPATTWEDRCAAATAAPGGLRHSFRCGLKGQTGQA